MLLCEQNEILGQMLVTDFIQLYFSELKSCTTTPLLDAQVLVAFGLQKTRSWVIAHLEEELESFQIQRLDEILSKVHMGVPVPYILGKWYFYHLEFFIDRSVLIPRPETELLVDKALAWLEKMNRPLLGLDVGTGSGCIAISLAYHFSALHMLASDISFEALQVARRNAASHQLDTRISFVQASLIPAITCQYDMICANPPYIPSPVLADLRVSRHEPRLALDGGHDGLQYIRSLLSTAPFCLKKPGLLLIEIEASQSAHVHRLARQAFPTSEIEIHNDLAGHPRLLYLQQ